MRHIAPQGLWQQPRSSQRCRLTEGETGASLLPRTLLAFRPALSRRSDTPVIQGDLADRSSQSDRLQYAEFDVRAPSFSHTGEKNKYCDHSRSRSFDLANSLHPWLGAVISTIGDKRPQPHCPLSTLGVYTPTHCSHDARRSTLSWCTRSTSGHSGKEKKGGDRYGNQSLKRFCQGLCPGEVVFVNWGAHRFVCSQPSAFLRSGVSPSRALSALPAPFPPRTLAAPQGG